MQCHSFIIGEKDREGGLLSSLGGGWTDVRRRLSEFKYEGTSWDAVFVFIGKLGLSSASSLRSSSNSILFSLGAQWSFYFTV